MRSIRAWLTRATILFAIGLNSGCAALPEALSAIGGSISLARAYIDWEASDSVTVIAPDCLLGLKRVRLSDTAIAALSRDEKVIIATNNALIAGCSGE
jgi:hypothetical protein